ncbi:zinc-dependent metalloprotease [Phocaeicola coprocola]|nr:zinc-dependent metalloprotease [Phocaeicola coprocola]MBV3867439.1 zinc-dependent metalloprotease [Phocaeicola coprocola]MBV4008486.1 zinc-dependent metalloprotease [Phocaeicola coprocola]MBV4033051.1 zinc-dependent metalloprotease [Phocaeicola coprocola]MBV4039607.1 zinc-dependent metalloprotease [Phocaeicola coprocola]MBV4061278.1 zinc-dependent metalloprotease [Phocaeicola coprocola]
MQNKPLLLRALAGALICIPVYASAGNASYYNASTEAKVFPWKKNKKKETTEEVSKTDFEKIASESNLVSRGMFNVYAQDGKYYFEIPVSLLQRDMLVVNKLQRVPFELNDAGVNRGTNYETQMIRFEWNKEEKKIRVRQSRPLPESPENDAITRSVRDNFISPLIADFKLEACNTDSTAVIIQINDIYDGSETSINNVFDNINLGTSAIKDLSRIMSIKAFPNNIVATSELTTKVREGMSAVNVTVEVSSSLVLLPEKPMMGRLDDPKVGYFTKDLLYFSDSQQKTEEKKYITRWRLEPKPEDREAYLRGELVEPEKPIVFYIENSTPYRWRKYIKQGIEDWQVAFERAGFKNAIIAKELPDSIAANADDINYSVVTYAASSKANAMGPSILDPRSGEILEADIMWWHNVISMVQEWITVQTGAIDPKARGTKLPDEMMGDAIRFVACHEVGHSLGLRHNMMGSWTFPTDSLRSKSFTDKMNSTASSIMDYARYNYVAQPGDGVTAVSPHIGPYDIFAIEYGYRWYGLPTPEAEKDVLYDFLNEHNGRLYKYSEAQDPRSAVDPRAQNEDLGDDPVRSSELGIANLKRIVPEIIKWTTTGEKGQTYEEASRLYYAVITQWNNYLYHVMANIGGIYIENTTVGDGVKTYTYVEKEKQEASLDFLLNEVLCYPRWLFDTEISDYTFLLRKNPTGVIEYAPSQILKNTQGYIFWDLLSNDRLMRMLENELKNGKKAFTVVEMMDKMHNSIFATTIKGGTPDVMERNLQKGFLDALITAAAESEGVKINKQLTATSGNPYLFHHTPWCSHDEFAIEQAERMGTRRELSFYGGQVNRISDAISVKRGELLRIKKLLESRRNTSDTAARYHYDDMILRINTALGLKD